MYDPTLQQVAHPRAQKMASMGVKSHPPGSLAPGRYEGVGWSSSHSPRAVSACFITDRRMRYAGGCDGTRPRWRLLCRGLPVAARWIGGADSNPGRVLRGLGFLCALIPAITTLVPAAEPAGVVAAAGSQASVEHLRSFSISESRRGLRFNG